jgi:putative membrane protein
MTWNLFARKHKHGQTHDMGNIFAILAAVIHILIFAMESLLWQTKAVSKIFRQSPADAQTTKLLAFNQGFYNLFLAIAILIGLYLRSGEVSYVGGTMLVLYALASIIGAGAVLIVSSRKMWRGALLQIVPAAIAFYFIAQ